MSPLPSLIALMMTEPVGVDSDGQPVWLGDLWPSGDEIDAARRIPIAIAKADIGEHDENISFADMEQRIGKELAEKIRTVSIALYQTAADYAATRGIIIADTKFEFGLDEQGTLHLMDEVLTADSSRFWPADSYAEGISPPSFDKQFVRDYLETLSDWNKTAPAPALPADVIANTGAKYREALQRLTGNELKD